MKRPVRFPPVAKSLEPSPSPNHHHPASFSPTKGIFEGIHYPTPTKSPPDLHTLASLQKETMALSAYDDLPKGLVDPNEYDQWRKEWIPRLTGNSGANSVLPAGFAIKMNDRIMTGLKGIHPTVLHFRGNDLFQDKKPTEDEDPPFFGDVLKSKRKTKKVQKKLFLGSANKSFHKTIPKQPTKSKTLSAPPKGSSSSRPPSPKPFLPPLSFHLPHEKNTIDFTEEARIKNFLDCDHRAYISISSGAPTSATKLLSPRPTVSRDNGKPSSQDPERKISRYGMIVAKDRCGSPSSPDIHRAVTVPRKKGTLLQGRVHAFTLDAEMKRNPDDLMVTNGMRGSRVLRDKCAGYQPDSRGHSREMERQGSNIKVEVYPEHGHSGRSYGVVGKGLSNTASEDAEDKVWVEEDSDDLQELTSEEPKRHRHAMSIASEAALQMEGSVYSSTQGKEPPPEPRTDPAKQQNPTGIEDPEVRPAQAEDEGNETGNSQVGKEGLQGKPVMDSKQPTLEDIEEDSCGNSEAVHEENHVNNEDTMNNGEMAKGESKGGTAQEAPGMEVIYEESTFVEESAKS